MAAKATYIQRGESLDHTNRTEQEIKAGTVLVNGKIVGVAGCDIPPGTVGSLHVMGVYAFPKGAVAIAGGTALFWDAAAGQVAVSGTVPLGYAVESAAAETDMVPVLIDRSAG